MVNLWTHAAARHLAPVGLAIRGELLDADYLQVDETPIDYLSPGHGKTKQGYLWVYHAPELKLTYYNWQLGRGHGCLTEVIGGGATGFRRSIGCDGYSAYDTFARRNGGVAIGACLAHIRRKFIEARGQSPPATDRILSEIQKLYRIERELREGGPATAACRWLVRRTRSRPACEKLKGLIVAEHSRHLPKSKLGEAINYALGQWEGFERYLADGKLEIGRVGNRRGDFRSRELPFASGFLRALVPHSLPWFRLLSPLVEPDVRISRIRLSSLPCWPSHSTGRRDCLVA